MSDNTQRSRLLRYEIYYGRITFNSKGSQFGPQLILYSCNLQL
jgi:hypothetical protein